MKGMLLPFASESYIFLSPTYEHKSYLISHSKGRK